ncbi:hypothetical protein XENTR_v10021869 [Xenopus tropicalis]|eukprot:XP_017952468.1 PREDICTED: galectin-4-like [Xenopus tropicalis]
MLWSPAIYAFLLLALTGASQGEKTVFTYPLEAGFYRHSLVTITGKLDEDAKNFRVDFKVDDSNIFLHFNPRFYAKKKIVLNTKQNGGWQKEEYHENPFKPGSKFKLEFQCEEDFFKVFLNGKYLLDFKARFHPLSTIKAIVVYGDVTVNKFSIKEM